ncbi:hypothetical protein K432DRAFT_407563 [Lepidopterella palustris CBS 459.81]|uniref:Uncharacterized protein n=1 Tax=Lepidopterella palustris CBS 459.81 TaxID=1314670 RepID=A0A8E2E4K3_9PEZI|nr:hypothetical protein K432DRAFT_407563 [Lepidopterella palustris CBS 459.81]
MYRGRGFGGPPRGPPHGFEPSNFGDPDNDDEPFGRAPPCCGMNGCGYMCEGLMAMEMSPRGMGMNLQFGSYSDNEGDNFPDSDDEFGPAPDFGGGRYGGMGVSMGGSMRGGVEGGFGRRGREGMRSEA